VTVFSHFPPVGTLKKGHLEILTLGEDKHYALLPFHSSDYQIPPNHPAQQTHFPPPKLFRASNNALFAGMDKWAKGHQLAYCP